MSEKKPDPRQWALDQIDSADVEGWLAGGLKVAEREVAKALMGQPAGSLAPTEAFEAAALEAAAGSLKVLRARPGFVPALARVGRSSAKDVLAQLGAGDRDKARTIYLMTKATLIERRMASAASTDAVNAAADARAAAWDEIVAGLNEAIEVAGEVAIKYAVPFLLAALKAAI